MQDIRGFKNYYKIDKCGDIYSLKRDIKYKHYGSDKTMTIPFKKLKKVLKKSTGYEQVVLRKNGIGYIFLVHRLVAETFLENKENKSQVNHKNGIRNDNSLKNLEWCTPSENSKHAYVVLGVKPSAKGKFGEYSHKHRGFIQKDLNGNLIKNWDCGMDIVRSLGCDSGSITRCAQGKYKSHKGYKWEYASKKPYKKNK